MFKTATTSYHPCSATVTAAAFNTTVHSSKLTLSKLDFSTFKPENYCTWSHIARIFFVQHELFDIINSNKSNLADAILHKVHSGPIQLADKSILQDNLKPTWSDV